MMNCFSRSVVGTFLIAFALGCSSEGNSEFVGKQAPETRISPLKPGSDITLSDLKGKVVLLDFWATWCGPCRKLMPFLAAMQEKYGAKGLVVVGISLEDRETVQAFRAQSHLNYDFFLDLTHDASLTWKADALPTTALVGRDGKVISYDHGFSEDSLKKMESDISDALASG
jgi:cytochrome c biogenesis protein CcmG, thiol:disulfide interchange protein DsbE